MEWPVCVVVLFQNNAVTHWQAVGNFKSQHAVGLYDLNLDNVFAFILLFAGSGQHNRVGRCGG